MIAVYLDNPNLSHQIINSIILNNCKGSNQVLFVTNYYFISEKIKYYNYSAITVAELLDGNDFSEADNWVENICLHWFKKGNGEDLSTYKNISLGVISEFDLWANEITPRVRIISVITKLILQNYEEIIIDSQIKYAQEVSKCLARTQNIKLIDMTYDPFPHIISQSKISSLKKTKVGNIWESIKINIYYSLFYINTQRTDQTQKNVLLIAEKFMENVIRVLKKNKFNFNLLLLQGKKPKILTMIDLLSLKIRILPIMGYSQNDNTICVNELEENINNSKIFFYNGHDYRDLFNSCLVDYVRSHWPKNKRQIDYYENILIKAKVTLLCVYADSPPFEKLLCLVAKKNQIKTSVLQHGFKDYSKDNDMNVADYALVWSEKTINDYLSIKNNQSKAIVVGSPIFEKSLNQLYQSPLNSSQSVLILGLGFFNLSNYSQYAHSEIYLRMAINFIKNNYSNYQIYFRPKPGEVIYYLQKYLFTNILSHDPMMIDDGPIHESFGKCNIVICADSTLGIEAYLHGKEVYIINPTNKTTSYPFNDAIPTNGKLIDEYEPVKMNLSDNYIAELTNNSSARVISAINRIIC